MNDFKISETHILYQTLKMVNGLYSYTTFLSNEDTQVLYTTICTLIDPFRQHSTVAMSKFRGYVL